MSNKEKAVEIYTKYFLKLKNIPFQDRIKKAKLEAVKYTEDKIKKCKEPDDHIYWEYLQNYIKKIDLTYSKKYEKLNNNCQEEAVH
jgi:hypothetical protein